MKIPPVNDSSKGLIVNIMTPEQFKEIYGKHYTEEDLESLNYPDGFLSADQLLDRPYLLDIDVGYMKHHKGKQGKIVDVDSDDMSFRLRFPDGNTKWFAASVIYLNHVRRKI